MATGPLFTATKPEWNLLLRSSFNTLSTGIHADAQHNLFWRRHGGLMRNFCPKYGSFVVVMPPPLTSPLRQQHPQCMTSSQSSPDSQSKMSRQRLPGFFITATVKQTSGGRRLLLVHAATRDVFRWPPRGFGHKASFTASGVPILSACLKRALILILWALGDNTALHKMLVSARNLIWYWLLASNFSDCRQGNLPATFDDCALFKMKRRFLAWR